MPNDDTDTPPPDSRPPGAVIAPAEAAGGVKQQARFDGAFLRAHRGRLLLVFVGVLLPLWGFGALAEDVGEGPGVVFPFDVPGLRLVHAMASAGLDRLFVVASMLGYAYGVVPVDIVLVLTLALKRRVREGLFAGLAMVGSLALNVAAKQTFGRLRPSLWHSIRPESSYSFPSGHAMGSMTLAAVVVLLCWPMRWHWPVALVAAVFVVLVGMSRIYLGVHYPSDILAGWMAALAWTIGIYALVFPRSLRPWRVGGSAA